jgi:carbon-monoxide dehydrogenase medium subunit
MTRQSTAEHSARVATSTPLLARALPLIGHFQIRNRGTIGGSLAHADPASELPAVARALDARIEVRSTRGTRQIPASEFFVSIWQTSVAPDEIAVAVHVPRWGRRAGFAIEEIAWRKGDFAICGVACAVQLASSGIVERASITLMGMGPTPIRADGAESAILGTAPGEIDLQDLARQAIESTSPVDDVHASASYRRQVGTTLVRRALASALEEAARG